MIALLMFNLKLSKNLYLTPLYQGELEAHLVYAGFPGSYDNSVLDLFCRLHDYVTYSLEPFRGTKENSSQFNFCTNIFICSIKQ